LRAIWRSTATFRVSARQAAEAWRSTSLNTCCHLGTSSRHWADRSHAVRPLIHAHWRGQSRSAPFVSSLHSCCFAGDLSEH